MFASNQDVSQTEVDGSKSSSPERRVRIVSTLALVAVSLFATWMGNLNGGYFTGEWAAVALMLGVLVFLTSLAGVSGGWSRWSAVASVLFVAYAGWSLLSLLWSPNQGDAWAGSGLTLLYLLVFWLTVAFVGAGASRRWVFAASMLGPAVIAAFTLSAVVSQSETFFKSDRLFGSVGYFNGEAAFLLVPFWTGIYLAGSRRVNPILRGIVLAGLVLCVSVAVLTQSRGAMVAMAASIPVYFLFSGQRLRGFFALVPVAAALFFTFPDLNDVYLAFLREGDPSAALREAAPLVWRVAAGAGLYGALWGIADQLWRPPKVAARVVGAVVLAGVAVALVLGAMTFQERVGAPVSWAEQKWEAFKNHDMSGKQQSRFLSVGTGRYKLWVVAWKDFVSHPVLGVGTHNYEATYYQKREEPGGFVRQPHSLPLEVLAERGVVGGVLFFGFLITCVSSGLWKRFRSLDTEGKAQIGALLAALCYWFVHSSADWFWQLPAVTLPAIVYLAMLVAPWQDNGNVRLPGWPLRLARAAIAVLAIVAIVPLYAAAYYLQQSDQEAANPQKALSYVKRAQSFDPVDPALREREAVLELQAGDQKRAERAYSEAIRLNPEHYAPYELSAALHEKMGEHEKALSLYRKASKLNPLDEELDQRIQKLRSESANNKP